MSYCCDKCGRMLNENQFYTSKNVEKYPPDGKLRTCKKCLTMHVDNWDPDTYMWILEELDLPYIKEAWDDILHKYATEKPEKINGTTILGRYISKMKLKQYSQYGWADTEELKKKLDTDKINAMKAKGFSNEEIDTQMAIDHTPAKPELPEPVEPVGPPEYIAPEDQEDEFSAQLTEEDKLMLTLKWGRGYTWEEKVRMEQFYLDMMNSYDIQGAGHRDTLVMLCKTSLKANELLDAGDIDGFQKMQKAYDSLMKMGKFTAAQNKEESGEFVDSIGELVTLCEKEGFIPRYYVDGPQDKVDKTLEDLQHYTHTLVTEETNLSNMLENSLREIEKDREREAHIDTNDDEDEEDELFNYNYIEELRDKDFEEYDRMIEEQQRIDNEEEDDM